MSSSEDSEPSHSCSSAFDENPIAVVVDSLTKPSSEDVSRLADITPRMSFWITFIRFYMFFWVVAWHTDRSPTESQIWQLFVPRLLNGNGQTATAVYFTLSGFFNARSAVKQAPRLQFREFVAARLKRQLRRWNALLLPNLVMCAVTDPLISLVMGGRPAVWVRDLAKPAFWAAYMVPVYSPLSDPRLWGLGNRTVSSAVWFNMALIGLDSISSLLDCLLWPVLRRVRPAGPALADADADAAPRHVHTGLGAFTLSAIVLTGIVIAIQALVIDPFGVTFAHTRGGFYNNYFQALTWGSCYGCGCLLSNFRMALVLAHPTSRLGRMARAAANAPASARAALCFAAYYTFEWVSRWHYMQKSVFGATFYVAQGLYSIVLLTPLVFDALPTPRPELVKVLRVLEPFRFSAFMQHNYINHADLPAFATITPIHAPACLDVWRKNIWLVPQVFFFTFLCCPAHFLLKPFSTLISDICELQKPGPFRMAWLKRSLPLILSCTIFGILVSCGVFGYSEYKRPVWPDLDCKA